MNYYDEIKNKLIDNEINRKVKNYSINKSDLETYYNVGKMLSEAGKHYGEGIINKYSIKLKKDVDKKYNTTNLKRYRQFYWLIEKGAPLAHQLTWSHYVELLPLKDINQVIYYINKCINSYLTRDQFRLIIKNNEYERINQEARKKILSKEKVNINDLIPNPILIDNNHNEVITTEKALHRLIIENISSFMKELGSGFSFIDNEYKIRIDNNFNYIDLLLYNTKYHCYVVVELKITELKKEHTGQIQIYMNYIDKNIKSDIDEETAGIIICKKNNQYVIDYCSDKRILSREYELL